MMERVFYFAYGSNLHPLRLQERIPSSQFVNRASMNGYLLSFNKISKDGSGKCTIQLSGCESDVVHGVVYSMRVEDKGILDSYEGEGYRDTRVVVNSSGQQVECFTYIARDSHLSENILPYQWYRELVLAGAEYHAMPETYIDAIRKTRAIPDPQPQRCRFNTNLLKRIKDMETT